MKILIATDVSPLNEGSGAERVVQEHAKELARRGHEVRIVFRGTNGNAAENGEWEGCALFPYRIDRRTNSKFIRTTLTNGAAAVTRATEGWTPDVVNIHQPFTGFAVLRASRDNPTPSLYTFLSPAPAEFVRQEGNSRGLKAWLMARAIRWVENFVLLRVDKISVLSEFMKEEIRRWHPGVTVSQMVKVPGGVDTERFRPPSDRAALRAKLGYESGQKVLLTVRNLEPRTGVDLLIEATGRLARQRRDFLLIIAGRGPLKEKLAQRARELEIDESVKFLGFVSEDELVDLYGAADVYIQPDTDLQGFGLPIVEAMACGTAVLATPVGGALDILSPDDADLLFPDLDAEQLAQHLDRALDDPRIVGDHTRYRRLAEERFSWRRVVDSVESMLLELEADDRRG